MSDSDFFSIDNFRATLTGRARLAFDSAIRNIDLADDQNDFLESAMRYAEAVDMLVLVKTAWAREGRPTVVERGTGGMAEHPLMVSIARWHNEVAKAGRALRLEPREAGKGQRGRPTGAASAKDRVRPKARKL